jgi:hypothetical protein
MMFEMFTLLVIVILKPALKKVIWMRPILAFSQALIFCLVILITLPFFKRRANSFYGGVTFARMFASTISFLCAVINKHDDNTTGIIFGSLAIGAFFTGFVMGVCLLELYQLLIIRKASSYAALFGTQKPDNVNLHLVDIYARISSTDIKSAKKVEKLLKLCELYSHCNEHVYLTRAVLYIYLRPDERNRAVNYLKKSLEYNPRITMKFSIFTRFRDLEVEMGEDQDHRKLVQMLEEGTKIQLDYHFYVRAFWKSIVSDDNRQNLAGLTAQITSCVKECDRIYSNLMNQFPKVC